MVANKKHIGCLNILSQKSAVNGILEGIPRIIVMLSVLLELCDLVKFVNLCNFYIVLKSQLMQLWIYG